MELAKKTNERKQANMDKWKTDKSVYALITHFVGRLILLIINVSRFDVCKRLNYNFLIVFITTNN